MNIKSGKFLKDFVAFPEKISLVRECFFVDIYFVLLYGE